jgi:cyclopropane fatty-acyl-phospholipid synthase-like methyltransferase
MSEFERWQTRFSVPEYVFGTAPNAFLRAQEHLLPPRGKALAVADGEGRNGVWLAERGLDVLSVDWSPNAIAKAQALARQRGVEITTECADVTSWDWPAAEFDVVVAIFIQFVGPDERTRMFAGMRQALKPGGLLLMQGYGPRQLEYKTGGPSRLENLYTRALLEQEFGSFSELSISEHDSLIQEGTSHVGMAALVDLVGRK